MPRWIFCSVLLFEATIKWNWHFKWPWGVGSAPEFQNFVMCSCQLNILWHLQYICPVSYYNHSQFWCRNVSGEMTSLRNSLGCASLRSCSQSALRPLISFLLGFVRRKATGLAIARAYQPQTQERVEWPYAFPLPMAPTVHRLLHLPPYNKQLLHHPRKFCRSV